MKKHALISLILILSTLLSGCFTFQNDFKLDADVVGEAKDFKAEELTITLTDQFQTTKSERGFAGYFTTNYIGVIVERCAKSDIENDVSGNMSEKEFLEYYVDSLEQEYSVEEKDGLFYYTKTQNNNVCRVFSYCSDDAYWTVQFITKQSDFLMYENNFFDWAKSVRFQA
ncbi:MAG: hypothetical protein J6R45_05275 [Clostridia bacterium]|nr:hypothetical protein [Clostridia bacterium]